MVIGSVNKERHQSCAFRALSAILRWSSAGGCGLAATHSGRVVGNSYPTGYFRVARNPTIDIGNRPITFYKPTSRYRSSGSVDNFCP
jgi:hypothetical protein